MALVVLTAIWFGDALTFRQQVMSLFIGLHTMTVLSLVISVALESARLGENDEWIGIFASPDLLSPVAGLGLRGGDRRRLADDGDVAAGRASRPSSSSTSSWP